MFVTLFGVVSFVWLVAGSVLLLPIVACDNIYQCANLSLVLAHLLVQIDHQYDNNNNAINERRCLRVGERDRQN